MNTLIKLLIIENNALIRKVLADFFESNIDIKVLGRLQNVQLAASKKYCETPDVIIYGCRNMGVENVLQINNIFEGLNIPILFFHREPDSLSISVAEVMPEDEWDILAKPGANLVNETVRLLPLIEAKLRDLTRLSKVRSPVLHISKNFSRSKSLLGDKPTEKKVCKLTKDYKSASHVRVIAIGASTGGTAALSKILSKLPVSMPGIAIVIHMPKTFTKGFAARLNSLCKIKVVEAVNPTLIERGQAIIATGGQHLKIEKKGNSFMAVPFGKDPINGHCPSVDVLFASVASVVGKGSIGVILTGMGRDGAEGLMKIKKHGGISIAQDEGSSIVFGMPKAAIEIGGVQEIVALEDISERLIREFPSF